MTDGQREKVDRNGLKILTKDMFGASTEDFSDRDFLQRISILRDIRQEKNGDLRIDRRARAVE